MLFLSLFKKYAISIILGDIVMRKIHPGRYVIVNKSGTVELRLTAGGSPVAYFGNNAEFAMLSGDVVQVNLKNGSVVFYKIGENGLSVSGPYLSI